MNSASLPSKGRSLLSKPRKAPQWERMFCRPHLGQIDLSSQTKIPAQRKQCLMKNPCTVQATSETAQLHGACSTAYSYSTLRPQQFEVTTSHGYSRQGIALDSGTRSALLTDSAKKRPCPMIAANSATRTSTADDSN